MPQAMELKLSRLTEILTGLIVKEKKYVADWTVVGLAGGLQI